MILPDTKPVPGERDTKLRLSATRGEFEPASFVLKSLESDVKQLVLTPSALIGDAGVVPVARVDIKVVKVWYQGDRAWKDLNLITSKPVLVPELLLNDDALIRVKTSEKKNYVRINNGAPARYVWTSDPTPSKGPFAPGSPVDAPTFPGPDFQDRVVKDAPALMPFSLAKGDNKQVWVTVHVPQDAKAGTYVGAITVTADGVKAGAIRLELRVLPFDLVEPKVEYSLYYRGVLHPSAKTVSSEYKTSAQMRAELQDMLDHGVANPTVYQSPGDKRLFDEVLDIRKSVGLGSKPLFLVGLTTSSYSHTADGTRLLKRDVSDTVRVATARGIPELFVYGRDESRGAELLEERNGWKAIHAMGAKVFVAGGAGQFSAVGDLLDVFVRASEPSLLAANQFHGVGHKIYSYANPQIGLENPLPYRRNYGLVIWAANYDGVMDYAYQACEGSCWNDFDCPRTTNRYRDMMFTYPTLDGVIDTVAWEGFREGIDDLKYLVTLEKYIQAAEGSGSVPLRTRAADAANYLAALRRSVPIARDDVSDDISNFDIDLADVRSTVTQHILGLGKTGSGPVPDNFH